MMSRLNRILKVSVFTLGIAAFGLLPALQASAGERRHDRRDRHEYNEHNKGYGFNNRRNNRHNYNYNYGYNNYNRHNRYNRHRGNGGAVILGVLAGGLLFSALNSNQRRHNDRRNQTVYVQQQPVYVQPTQQQWTARRPVQPQNSSCLQVREYQTTITVGNQSVPAYGQSCLQPDGSWKLGPATPVPSY